MPMTVTVGQDGLKVTADADVTDEPFVGAVRFMWSVTNGYWSVSPESEQVTMSPPSGHAYGATTLDKQGSPGTGTVNLVVRLYDVDGHGQLEARGAMYFPDV
jgi:hypothetical protein